MWFEGFERVAVACEERVCRQIDMWDLCGDF